MDIRVAANAGFCFGVKRAIRMALDVRPRTGESPTYILGALVHNPLVTREFVEQGFVHVDSHQEVWSGRIVLPSHGVTPAVRQDLEARGIEVIDATCPFVARAQRDVESFSRSGRTIFIVGDKGHPEVIGLAGHSLGRTEVVSGVDEAVEAADRLSPDTPIAVIAQTTQDGEAFRRVVDALRNIFTDVVVRDTICTATCERQQGVIELASQVDVMIVVGGRNSANTRRLCEISRSLGTKTYHIESADELGEIKVAHGSRIGVAAGASTPGWAIKEVVSKMEEKTVGLNAEAGETTSEQAEPCQCSNCDEAKDTAAEVGVTSAMEPEAQVEDQTDAAQEAGAQEADVQDVASGADEPNEASGQAAGEEPDSQHVADDVESPPEADQVEAPSEPAESKPAEDVPTMSEVLGSEYVPQEGEIIRGRVVQVNDDEILVDIGYKSEAVIPKRELSVRSFNHPSEVVSAGDEVYCVVLSVDAEGEGAVVLSKKRADLIRAWERVEEAFSQGKTIEGKVVDVVKGGVTVDIGLRGFVPASQIALRPVANLKSVLGQTLTMKILEVEKDRNNVVLSQRVVLEERLAQAKAKVFENVKEGDIVDGTVTRLTSFGAFVDIGDGVEGLLHVSDISWNRIGHPGQALKEGQKVRVTVLNMDRERERISLGLKQTQDDPWTKVPTKYPVGTVTDGKITRLTDFGAFVELEPGIEGLVHVSQISRERVEKPSDVLKEGQMVQVKVISLRQEQRRIGLSIKEVEEEVRPERPSTTNRSKAKQEEPQGGATIGELVGDILKQHELAGQADADSGEAEAAGDSSEEPEAGGGE
ncbi:MAG: bifunctional 4-hydroxy-3-methylbut-2-enyl diphosphate reductase/30S ribosomal protein S1 [Firmicutes bacterium]|nr:bifunctional 4-hydroxy-3-methylbut-2-enyl diphosphate reductase/30S ribosomal protein S1 [Bacillota bacterium]